MKGIIFCDLDGTLIDSREDIASAVNATRETFSLPPLPLHEVVSYIGNGVSKLIERAFLRDGIYVHEVLPIMKKNYAEKLLSSTTLYEGVKEGLEIIKSANFAIVLLTNKTRPEAEKILSGLLIKDFFSIIIGDGDGIPLKPDPAAVQIIFKQHKTSRNLCRNSWIIGDNWTDLECGRRAGIKCAFAAYGFGKLQNEKYDFLAENFMSFAKMIVFTQNKT